MKLSFGHLLGVALCSGLIGSCQAQVAPRTSNMSTNLMPVGKEFDLQGFIDGAVKAGQKRVVVPPGRYRVKPKNRQHLVLENLSDIEIVADGVELICTQTTRAVTIENCANLTLRGLTVDYDPLPFTQGRITAISADKTLVDAEIFEGYPSAKTATTSKYEFFKPDTRTLGGGSTYPTAVEAIDERHLRIIKTVSDFNTEVVGDLIVIASENAPQGQIPHAFYLHKSRKVTLENIDLWASNTFGFFESECDGTTYQRCRIDRRPAATDLVKRGDARLRSLNADAFHSNAAAQGPQILNCTAKWMGDDAINIRGEYSMITATDNGKHRVLVRGKALVAGDPVELWTYNGILLPDAKVVSVESDGKINADERAFLSKQRMDARYRTGWEPDVIRITLDRAAELPMGSLLASTKSMGNGFLVQGNDFGFNRSRGILIKGSNGQIRDNKLTQTMGSAILVAPEYWWLESGSSKNLIISGNTIRDCAEFAIQVTAVAGQGGIAPSGAHSDITIAGNTISGSPLPNILATSTDGLRIEGNVLTPNPTRQIVRWMLHNMGLGKVDKADLKPIMTLNSTAPKIEKNSVK